MRGMKNFKIITGQLYVRYGYRFRRVKRPGCGVDHPSPSTIEVRERIELYLYSPSGPSWSVLG